VAEAIGHTLSGTPLLPAEVVVVDGLEAVSRAVPISRLGAAAYFLLTRPRLRWLYKRLFVAADCWPERIGQLLYILSGKRVRAWLCSAEADLIVSTFPFVSYVVGEAIGDLELSVRLVSVVTDGGSVNRSWFSGRVDAFFVTDDEALDVGRGLVADARRVNRVALPLRPGFYSFTPRTTARRLLGLENEFTVLIWGGGQGMADGIVKLAEEFQRQESGLATIFVTGSNRRLASRLMRVTGPGPSQVFERCEDVPLLLSAVDLVMGKPGWVSLAEASAAGLHTICFDALPGQEIENLRVCINRGSASWEPNVVAAVRAARVAAQQGQRGANAPRARGPGFCAAILDVLSALDRPAKAIAQP
jgi:UDP-N-acetylglucosamine:LPS N-acetylglucosamine transferase